MIAEYTKGVSLECSSNDKMSCYTRSLRNTSTTQCHPRHHRHTDALKEVCGEARTRGSGPKYNLTGRKTSDPLTLPSVSLIRRGSCTSRDIKLRSTKEPQPIGQRKSNRYVVHHDVGGGGTDCCNQTVPFNQEAKWADSLRPQP